MQETEAAAVERAAAGLGLPAPSLRGRGSAGLVSAPLLWLGLIYLVALLALFITAFWTVDFGVTVTRDWNLDNFKKLFQDDVYRTVVVRTILVAVVGHRHRRRAGAAGRVLHGQDRAGPVVREAAGRRAADAAVGELPRQGVRLAGDGHARRRARLGASAGRPGFGLTAVIITLAYLWLPFMVLPIYAGFLKLPDSLLEASSDLGRQARPDAASVAFPMIVPSLAAGSIFTFSLSLGDYIAVQNVGGKTQMLGNLVFARQATDIPFAAALATVSVVIMIVYLALVRRTGALENL